MGNLSPVDDHPCCPSIFEERICERCNFSSLLLDTSPQLCSYCGFRKLFNKKRKKKVQDNGWDENFHNLFWEMGYQYG